MHTTTDSSPAELDVAGEANEPTWRLHVVASPDAALRGQPIELKQGQLRLGRLPSDPHSLAVQDPKMSREHLLLRVRNGFSPVELHDLGSRNGVYQAGHRIQNATLGHGAVIRFGRTVAVLESDHGRHLAFVEPTVEVPGRSAIARATRAAIALAAPSPLPVLVCGETGTGKEYAALALHGGFSREGELVRLNVAAVPENLFEAELFGHARGAFTGATAARMGRIREAHRGTLVLDEIGELSLTLQAKLLRVLEERTLRPVGGERDVSFDVRFVAATNADLNAAVREGRFRADLLARLQMHLVRMHPLAARRPDLLELCDVVAPLDRTRTRRWSDRLEPDAVEWLLLRRWGGNMRELKAVLMQLSGAALARRLGRHQIAELLPATGDGPSPFAVPTNDPTPLAIDALGAARTPPQPSAQTANWVVRTTPNALPIQPSMPRPDPRRSPVLDRPDDDTLRGLLRYYRGNIELVAQELGRHRRQVYRWLDYAGIGLDEVASYREEGLE